MLIALLYTIAAALCYFLFFHLLPQRTLLRLSATCACWIVCVDNATTSFWGANNVPAPQGTAFIALSVLLILAALTTSEIAFRNWTPAALQAMGLTTATSLVALSESEDNDLPDDIRAILDGAPYVEPEDSSIPESDEPLALSEEETIKEEMEPA